MIPIDKRRFAFSLVAVVICISIAAVFYPASHTPISFPDGKAFAFTIFDDTDCSTVANVKPAYDALYKLGIITTKSTWVLPSNGPDALTGGGQTLSDPDYLAFVLELQRKGFEIASHGARDGSTKRLETHNAIERFKQVIGHYPHAYANHSSVREALYWARHRLDFWPLKALYDLSNPGRKGWYLGHVRDSEYFWGDIARERITYVRNFTFHDINTLKANPSMPYHDPDRPYVNFWFSSSDGARLESFNRLLSRANVDRLAREGGVCIVYTHFASGFVSKEGTFDKETMERLQYLASKNGYFVPVSTLLDYLRKQHQGGRDLGMRERIRLNIQWTLEKVIHGSS